MPDLTNLLTTWDRSLNTSAAWNLHWTARLLGGWSPDRPQVEVECAS